MRFLAALILVLAACGGSQTRTQVNIAPTPEPVTRAVLSGPLCAGDACQCRDSTKPGDGGAGIPDAEGTKRFEVRVGPSENAQWVMVDDMVLYKSDEHATDCFYIDLPTGKHPVTLRVSRAGGLSASLSISEYGKTTQSWYETFRFSCGSPGSCSTDELDSYRASLAQYQRNLHDACGSTKVREIGWDAGRAPDQLHPQDLQLELTLDIDQFEPKFPHGDSNCASNNRQ
jgi:hypothetical protein